MLKKLLFYFCFLTTCLSAEDIAFESATPSQIDFLTKFGMDSDKTYAYWTVSERRARPVFQVRKEHFNNGVVRVMKKGNEIIGFFTLLARTDKRNSTLCCLDHFFIKPSYIGSGYGRRLFLEAIRVAKEELCWEAILFESDPHAAGFYSKMGAKKVGDNPCGLNPAYRSPVFVYTIMNNNERPKNFTLNH